MKCGWFYTNQLLLLTFIYLSVFYTKTDRNLSLAGSCLKTLQHWASGRLKSRVWSEIWVFHVGGMDLSYHLLLPWMHISSNLGWEVKLGLEPRYSKMQWGHPSLHLILWVRSLPLQFISDTLCLLRFPILHTLTHFKNEQFFFSWNPFVAIGIFSFWVPGMCLNLCHQHLCLALSKHQET